MNSADRYILETIVLGVLFLHYTIGMIVMLYIEASRVRKGKDRYTVTQFIANALNWPVIGYKEWKNSRAK
ncbi:MAG: hypothetical protein ABFR65_12120 [Pseudomonadota bacterium]